MLSPFCRTIQFEANSVKELGMGQRKTVFYGWWVIAALFVVGMLGPMGRYAITIFGPFISQELSLGSTSIGLALSLGFWIYAFVSLPIGWMIDRTGSQRVIFVGGLVLLIGLWGFSNVRSLWQLFIFTGATGGIGVGMTHYVATQSTARKWFKRRAGLAGGILSGAFWVGSSVFSPLLTGLAASIGWRTACSIFAFSAGAVIMLLAALVIRSTPESMGLQPDGATTPGMDCKTESPIQEVEWTLKEAVSTRCFQIILLGYGLVGISTQGLLGHLVLWAADLGVPKGTTGLFVTSFSVAAALTSLFVGGPLGDRFGKRRVLSVTYCVSSLVLLTSWIEIQSPRSLLVLISLIGLVHGVSAGPALWVAYVGDLFGRASVGKLFGIMTVGYGLIGGLGPFIWGSIRDITGTYNLACLVSALCFLLGMICIILAKPVTRGRG